MDYNELLDQARREAYERIAKMEPGTKEYAIACDVYVKMEEAAAKYKKIEYDEYVAEKKIETDSDVRYKEVEVRLEELRLKCIQMQDDSKRRNLPSPDTILICIVMMGSTLIAYIAEGKGILMPKAFKVFEKLWRFVK